MPPDPVCVFSVPSTSFASVRLLPDSQLAAGTLDGRVFVWHIPSRTDRATLYGMRLVTNSAVLFYMFESHPPPPLTKLRF